jgi:hypothetical protein
MSNLQLLSALSLYILSIVTAFILLIVKKNYDKKTCEIFIIIHSLLLLSFLLLALYDPKGIARTFFLIFFCSGIVTSAVLLRSSKPLAAKFYISIFPASLLLFVLWPSMLVRIITFNTIAYHKNQFKITSNYYLEEEQALINRSSGFTYKVTQKFGLFHKTLATSISSEYRLDSIRLLNTGFTNVIELRGYYKKTANFEKYDSINFKIDMHHAIKHQ